MTNVQAVMSTEVAIVRTTEMVGTVRRMMIDDGIHSVPILDDAEKLQGIITSSDLVEEWDADMGVTMVMTEAVETVSPLATVVDAARSWRCWEPTGLRPIACAGATTHTTRPMSSSSSPEPTPSSSRRAEPRTERTHRS